MLQKLEDLWTYKDWEVLQRKNRPVFGPLRKITDDSSPTHHRRPVAAAADTARFRRPVVHVASANNNVHDEVSGFPGFYNAQDWREQFEREMGLPVYTGYCISHKEFNDHLKAKFPDDKPTRALDKKNTETRLQNKRPTTKSARSASDNRHQHTKSVIDTEIDQDIAKMAAGLDQGDATADTDKKLDEHAESKPETVRTRIIRISDTEEVTVNTIENSRPLQHKSVPNTKTPGHSPSRPVQFQKILSQIPFSTKTLLHRCIVKLNFLSSKQKFEPEKSLFRSKSECIMNHTNFWDSRSQQFITIPSFQYQTHCTLLLKPEPTVSHVKKARLKLNTGNQSTTNTHYTAK